MEAEYEGIWGVVFSEKAINRRIIVKGFLIGHKDLSLPTNLVGFDINDNREPVVPIVKPVEKTIEELVENYQPRKYGCDLDYLQDVFDELNWCGYCYVLKTLPEDRPGKPPLVVVSNPCVIDLDLWTEISTEAFIREVNDRTSVVLENKDDC
jgi:hypothetical protein